MPKPWARRTLALFAVALALAAGACPRGGDDDADQDVEVTAQPSPEETPSVEAVADFQLVGMIDEAFAGEEPDIDIPAATFDEEETTTSPEPGADPMPSPTGGTPAQGGILRLQIDDLSEDLRTSCNLDQDAIVELFWTEATRFDPATVLDDLEDEIEDRTAAMTGSIFRSAGATEEEEDEEDVTATASPAVTGEETTGTAATASPGAVVAETDCILVADQIAFTRTTLPTPRPRVTRRPAAPGPANTPAPTARATATPRRTSIPATPRPTDTDEPDPSPPVISP